MNLYWIKYLNLRSEIVKLLEENVRGKLLDICLGSDVFDLTPKANKNNQVGVYQIKKLLHFKKMKRQPT